MSDRNNQAARNAQRAWRSARFDTDGEETPDPLANLLDLMLVFACGLIAALIGMNDRIEDHFRTEVTRSIEKGSELPGLPDSATDGAAGFEPIGQVYRDPESGKLILIGE